MTTQPEPGWSVRICRPALQDFQRVLPRYYARSELVRQILKLQWWESDQPAVVDLGWKPIPDTELHELLVEEGWGLTSGMRIVFFQLPPASQNNAIWVLGGIRINEEFTKIRKEIYRNRSVIVRKRGQFEDE